MAALLALAAMEGDQEYIKHRSTGVGLPKAKPLREVLVTHPSEHRSPEESTERIRRAQQKRDRRAAKRANSNG
jgi:hypothetical protein